MQRTELASLYKATPADGTKVTVCGWAKTVRDSKNIGFISLSDGSCYKPVQIVFQADKLANYAEIAKCGLYTSFEVTGTLVVTPGAKQPFEINADEITVLGPCGGDYPLQKKKMGMDYLRTMTHLPRRRVLDDRAGDGFRRPEHLPGDRRGHDPLRHPLPAGQLPRRAGLLQPVL
jgi:asparaginyl-tRNA synthetase